eukprot:COSAG02_NODE_50770_length_318_cov_0.940639_1_plen_29_part_10
MYVLNALTPGKRSFARGQEDMRLTPERYP